MDEKEFNSTNLAKVKILYANQRTYLSYIRTGFAVTLLAVKNKKQCCYYNWFDFNCSRFISILYTCHSN